MISKRRFSKMKVARVLARKISALIKEHGFDPDRGWEQVEGKGEEVNRAYGEFLGCVHVAMGLDIEQLVWGNVAEV